MGGFKDLTGQRFGRLIVIKKDGKDKNGNVKWTCKCDCGNTTQPIRSSSLRNGSTKSCGCLNKEKSSENMKKLRAEWEQKEEYKLMQKEANIKRWQDEEYREAHSGKNSTSYNHDLTEEEREQGRSIEGYNEWRNEVKEKANFTCDCCYKHGGNMNSHHLDGYDWCKERRIDVNNGVCLCENCHKEFHKIYGYGNNTKEQYIEFKENKNKGEW